MHKKLPAVIIAAGNFYLYAGKRNKAERIMFFIIRLFTILRFFEEFFHQSAVEINRFLI